MSDDDVHDQILQGVKCRICTNYMKSAIFTCESGHSVCEKCEQTSEACSCSAQFTKSRNFALESVASKVIFPCMNAHSGCNVKLPALECIEHEKVCNLNRSYTCAFPNCAWHGTRDKIFYHWRGKRVHKPYGNVNNCHLRLKNNKLFINLVKAYDQLFWYIFQSHLGMLYWSLQYIGNKNEAKNYYYEIKMFQQGHFKQAMLFSNYCQSVTDKQREENVFGVAVSFDTISHFIKKDLLTFQLHVFKIKDDNDACVNVVLNDGLGARSLAHQNEVPEDMLIDLNDDAVINSSESANSSLYPELPTDSNLNNSQFAAVVEYRIPKSDTNTAINDIPPLMSLNIPAVNPSSNSHQNQYGGDGASSTYPSIASDEDDEKYNPRKGAKQKGRNDNGPIASDYPSTSTAPNLHQNVLPTAPPRANRRVNPPKQPKNKAKGKSDDDCVIL